MSNRGDKQSARPAFQSVEIDEIDVRLEQKALEKGIPTLVAPKPSDKLLPVKKALDHRIEEKGDQEENLSENPVAQATPRSRMRALNVELPDYAWIELKTKAAIEMVSVRHLIMEALQVSGIKIEEHDMIEDGRRLRGKNSV